MTQDIKFGRRPGAGKPQANPSQQQDEAAPAPARPALTLEDQASAVSMRRVVFYATGATAVFFTVLAAPFLPLPDVATAPAPWATTSSSAPKPAASGSPDTLNSSEVDERQQAAMKFFGYYHLNTRIRADYCAQHGVDLSSFIAKFSDAQSPGYMRANDIIKAAGLTQEKIYQDSRAELTGLIENDMSELGSKMGTDAAGGCKMMAQNADRIVPGIDFAKLMPEAHDKLFGT